MSRASKSRFLFWKKKTQRSFKKLLRPLVFEGLESRRLFDATNWTNPFQRLDVSGGVGQSVDPLDALFIVNEINSPFYTSQSNGKLPDLPDSNRDSHPYLDVDCDGYVSALDVLSVVNAINLGSHPAGWKPEFNTSQALDGGFVSSASCGPKLHEGASYLTQISTEVTIPPNATNLSFRLTLPSFDTTSPAGMKDAFEAALVDQNGNALVFPYSRSRDSFLNMTEGQVPVTAPGVKVSGDKVDVNVSQIPAGTTAKLVIRLVNNDRDTQSNAGVSELQIATDGIGVPIGSASPESAPFTDRRNEIDFSHFSDVTGSLVAKYGRTSHFDDSQVLYSDLAVQNNGIYPTKTPLLLVLKNFSDLSVRVRNADGLTPDGDPYFDFSTLVADGVLSPDETTASRNVTFYNPNQTQFTYEIAVLSELNSAPLFISEPDVEALVGKVYTHVAAASDLDGDKLSYSILSGPAGMTVDSVSGTVTWQPNTSHLGNHSIILRVDDGHGGTAQQTYTLAVTNTPPNRPPVFTSRPIVDSNFGQPYVYDAKARDDDEDALTFRLVSGPQTMQVNAESGRVTWTPTSDKLVYDAAKDFSATVNPGNPWSYGWTASQGSAFTPYPRAFNVSGLDLWDDANQFIAGAPVVSHNGTPNTLNISNIQWAPGQLSFHPGPSGQRSVVRWTAPVGGDIRIDAEFGNLDLNRAATTDVHVLHNNVSIFDGIVQQNNKVSLAPVQRQVKVGDTIDFVVGEGANSWTFDTTSLAANIVVERQTSVAATLMAQDGRGGSATQNVVIDIQPAVGNHAPIFVSEPITEAFVIDPSTVGTPVDLSKWSVVQYPVGGQGPAEWVLEQNNTVARQRKNADPSILVSDFNFSNDQVRGGFRADLPVADDDFMGFVFGYQDQQHYYLFDWKKATQSDGADGVAQVGMSVKIVDADAPLTVRDLWNTDTKGAQVRTIYHNSIPWEFGVDYDFSLEFHPGQFTIIVSRGATKLAEIQMQDSTYTTGKFGFYNFSQGPVSYSGFRHQIAPSYAYKFEALDPDGDALNYRLVDGPVGMNLTPNTNQLTWTPGAAAVGSHHVVLQAEDGRGGLDVQKFTVLVTNAIPGEIRGTIYNDLNGNGIRDGFNVLRNKDFESGLADFTSELLNVSPGVAEGAYVVGSNPKSFNVNFGSFGDHTTGTGQMMIINGATDSDSIVWAQEITVNPHTQYQFGLWAASAYAENPASLQFYVNDELIGPSLTLTSQVGQWQFLSASWNSAGSTNVKVAVRNHVGIRAGNDFVIDDIEFRTVEPFEPGLADRIVYLDPNNNNVRDPGELFTNADSQGNYSFTNLPPGAYIVRAETLPDWLETAPGSGNSNSLSRGGFHRVDLASGEIETGKEFGTQKLDPNMGAEIRGTVFHDLNGDGKYSAGTNGRVVIAHDVNTFASNRAGEQERLFAVNVAKWLTPTTNSSILAVESNASDPERNYDAAVIDAITQAGFKLDVTSRVDFTLSELLQYQAIFVGQIYPSETQFDSQLLRSYVKQGGSVYLYGGTAVNAPREAEHWSSFLGEFGFQFTNDYNSLYSVPINSAHPLFSGVTVLASGLGSNIVDLEPTNPRNQILVSSEGNGVYAIYDANEFEQGLKGWGVYLDQNQNQLLDTGEMSTSTDSNGNYAFTNLPAGNYVVAEASYPTYDAVQDFTTTENPNSPWTYGYSQTRGSTFQQSTISDVVPNFDYWSATTSGPHITHNLTGSTIPGGITYPPDALNLDPSFDGRNAVLRFTAPVTDTYRVTGRFQGIDLTRGSTTDVAILQNSNSILIGNINGFFTDLATTPGAIVPYDLQVTLQQGDTLDFSVGQGTGGSLFDSTGVSAIISGKNWRQTAPLTKTHPITVVAGEVRKNVDFGNLELAAQPPKNNAPQITSTAVTESGVGARYRVTATATDVDGDRLTFDLPVKPSGMTVDPSTGIIIWTPTADQAGVQNVILRVSDGRGGVDLQSFQVNVASRNSGPTITSRPLGPARANLPYQYRIRAQDAEGDAIEYSLNTPAIGNMTVDSVTGVFSWLPSSSNIGSHTIEVTATDSSGDGQLQKFTLEVLASAPNREPQILSTPRDQVRLGSSYMYAIDAIDPDGDPLAYRLDVAPDGMAIDLNGLITWTPTASQFGNNPVQVSVSDGLGGVRMQAFTIAVLSKAENHAPVISSTPTFAATLGLRYNYDVKATDENGDTLAFSLDTKPTGMSIDALTGAIRWIPTADQLGAQPIVVRVTDPQGASATQSLTVTVRGSNLAPEISSLPKTIAAVGRAYSYMLKATDPEGGPLTYSLAKKSGNMIIDSSGAIQWVPGAGEVGNVNVTVRVRDDQGASVEQSFTVVVAAAAPNAPPIITSQPNLGATVGQRYQYQVTATDPEGGAVRFAFLEVPNGMTIDESTGLIQWTSDAAGIGRVTVLVGDFDGGEAEQTFEVTVRSSNVAPQITSTPVVTTAASVTYRYDVRANDPNFDPLTFALVTGPTGMTMDNLGRITWTTAIADAGTHRVKLTVSDDRGASASQEYDLVVTADTEAPKVRIQVDSNPVGLNETLIIQVNASDNTGVKALDVTVDGKAISLDTRGRASVLMTQIGTVRIAAVATDSAGNAGQQTMDVKVVDTSVTGSPTVDVTVPAENATITAPTDVIGTVQDPNLVSWKLEVAPFDGGDFKQIATGTNQIANGKIATFDPTILQNGSYIVRLTALNRGGLTSSIDTTVNVSGNLKLGNFTLSFSDLSIAVGGIPIFVSRTYDTLTANQDGELGFGWKLAFRDVDLRTSLPKTGDEAGGLYTPFRDGTRVYVTLPGGQRQGFTFRPKAVGLFDPYQRERDVPPEFQSGNGLNAVYFVPNFVPDKGVTAKLIVNRFKLTKQGNEYFQFGGGLPYNPLDTAFGSNLTLASKDGANYRIDGQSGQLVSVIDRDGNSLTLTDEGIKSSFGPSISFTRNAQGRITSVSDLAGKSVQYQYDHAGDLVSVTDRENNKTQFVYSDSGHYLERIIDPLGRNGTRIEYDASGRIAKVIGGSNSSSGVSYDLLNSTTTITNARGFATTFRYDSFGNVISETNALNHTTTRTFDENGNVLSVTDPLGHTFRSTYDSFGNSLTDTDALNNITFRTYTTINLPGAGEIALPQSETDALGNTLKFEYDSQGRLISAVGPDGTTVVRQTYDSRGLQLSSTDALNRTTENRYNSAGKLVEAQDASGHKTSFGYSANGVPSSQSTTRTNADGQIVSISQSASLNGNDQMTRFSGSVGQSISLTYDALGKQTSFTNSNNGLISYTTDDAGHSTGLKYPDNTSDSYVRDANGNIVSSIDRQGRTSQYVLDELDRLIKTTYPDGAIETIEYDAAGRVVKRTNANGNFTTFSYDSNNRLTSTTDALGNTDRIEYDAIGRTIAETDARGNTTRYVYDSIGNRTRTIFPNGTSQTNTYDAVGNVIRQTDEAGQSVQYVFSPTGRITQVVDPIGGRTNYTYDELGNMLSQTDANGHVTRWEYDNAGHMTKMTLPIGMSETNDYGSGGKATGGTTFNGKKISYTYDENNRIKTVSFDGILQRNYTYTSYGQVATVQDSRGTTSYTYDQRDRLIKVVHPDQATIEYTYDKVGNRLSIKTSSGTTLYGYDAANRLIAVTAPDSTITRYTYDSIGNLIQTHYSSGVTETRTYDQSGQLLTLTQFSTLGVLASYAYSYDTLGLQTDIVESGGRSVHYTYDVLGRLVRESVTDPAAADFTIDYTYDAVGNRLTRNHSIDGRTTYVHDANDRLLTETTGAIVISYTYDSDGNLLSRSGDGKAVTAQWNALDQLISVDVTDNTGTHNYIYEYDRSGNRVSEKVDGQETRFLIDELQPHSQVLAEYSPSGTVSTSYVYGRSRIAQQHNGQSSLYLPDGLGSTRLLTDSTGNILNSYDYDSFGNIISSTGSSFNRFGFTGEQLDGALGGYYLRARIYNPATGRFVSQDPAPPELGLSQSINRYVYALNQPVTRTDPSGLFSDLVSTLKTVAIQSGLDMGRGVSLGLTAAGALQGAGVVAYFYRHDHNPLNATGFVQGFSLSTDDLLGRVSVGLSLDQVIPLTRNILKQSPLYPTSIGIGLGVNLTPPFIGGKVSSRLLAARREGAPVYAGVELHVGTMFNYESPSDAGGAQSSANWSIQGAPTQGIGQTLYVSLPAKTYGSLVNYSLIPKKYLKIPGILSPARFSVPSGISSQFSYGVYIGDLPSFTGAGGILVAGAFQATQTVYELFN